MTMRACMHDFKLTAIEHATHLLAGIVSISWRKAAAAAAGTALRCTFFNAACQYRHVIVVQKLETKQTFAKWFAQIPTAEFPRAEAALSVELSVEVKRRGLSPSASCRPLDEPFAGAGRQQRATCL